MTETEWLDSTDPLPMLAYLDGKASNRKFWLFTCGNCRRHAALMADSLCRTAIETGERYADGVVDHDELMEASEEAFCRRSDIENNTLLEAAAMAAAFAVVDPNESDPNLPSRTTADFAAQSIEDFRYLAEKSISVPQGSPDFEKALQKAVELENVALCRLLRCIVGNPFRTVAILPALKDVKVAMLAQDIYDERAFDRMPALADALEEGGCDNADILAHCRDSGKHARGCWVIDLVFGKN